MRRLPTVLKLKDDELLYSYLLRTAQANGFDDLKFFMTTYVWPDLEDSRQRQNPVSYDVNDALYTFMTSAGLAGSPADVYQKTSLFHACAPFMNRAAAGHHVGALDRRNRFRAIDTPPDAFVRELKVCPECRKEEGSGWYYHRAHQAPGVGVCWKHDARLLAFTGPRGQERDGRDGYFRESTGNPDRAYALFFHDMLTEEPDFCLDDIRQVLTRFLPYDAVNGPYISIPDTVGALVRAGVTFRDLRGMAGADDGALRKAFGTAIDGRFRLISPYRNDIVELACLTCGTRFLTTPHRAAIGWGCPVCDRALTRKAMFQRLFDGVSGGDYELLSDFKGMQDPVTVRHTDSGTVFSVKARSFIDEGARGELSRKVTEKEAREAIERTGEFELVSFTNTNEPVLIRHKACGRTFAWNYHKFLKEPWCKVCRPRVRTEETFRQEIRDLTGDEYTLAGPYLDKDHKVMIRHNTCGREQAYWPHAFLDGQRCRFCTREVTDEALASCLEETSCGRYVFRKRETRNLVLVEDTKTGEKKRLSTAKIMQELKRPTPSPVLPMDEKQDVPRLPLTRSDRVSGWIREHYQHGELIHLDDLKVPGLAYQNIKAEMNRQTKAGALIGAAPGIYRYPEDSFTPEEIMESRFLLRNGQRIGFLSDASFAYTLGLLEEKPDRINLVTNKEAATNQHGRRVSYLGLRVRLRGTETVITDENFRVLAVTDFLKRYRYLHALNTWRVVPALKAYVRDHGLRPESFQGLTDDMTKTAKNDFMDIF